MLILSTRTENLKINIYKIKTKTQNKILQGKPKNEDKLQNLPSKQVLPFDHLIIKIAKI